MQSDSHKPSKNELVDEPRPLGSQVKAVVLGLGVDIGGSLLAGFLLGVAYSTILSRAGMSPSQIEEAVNIPLGSWFSILSVLVGFAFSVLGGYICARISRRNDYKLGFILGGATAIYGLLQWDPLDSSLGNALLSALSFCAVLLGTKLGRSKGAAPILRA